MLGTPWVNGAVLLLSRAFHDYIFIPDPLSIYALFMVKIMLLLLSLYFV